MTLSKKIIAFFSSTVIIVLSISLIFVYFQSKNMLLDQEKEKALSMIKTFEATMSTQDNYESIKDYEDQLQQNLKRLQDNLPELLEFNIYRMSNNPIAVASNDSEKLNKKADQEDIQAAKNNEVIVLVTSNDEGSLEVDVTAPLHINGKVQYVAGIIFSLTEEVQQINQLLIKILLLGIISVFLIIFVVWFFNIRKITNQIKRLTIASNKIANGNLDVTVDVQSKDDIGKLEANFNNMVHQMRQLVHQVKEIGYEVESMSNKINISLSQSAQSSEHIATTISDLSERSSQQSVATQEGNNRVEGIVSGLDKIANYSAESQKLTIETSALVEEGVDTIENQKIKMIQIKQASGDVQEVISTLAIESKEISEIVEVVNGIAEQINLLSLNAAIEAARAGEHGKGFSVVANEVGNLAEQSKESVNKISSLITGIQKYINNAVIAMKNSENVLSKQEETVIQTNMKFNEIKDSVLELKSQIDKVYRHTEDLNEDAKKVGENISNIAVGIHENAAGTEVISASIQEQTATIQEISNFMNKIVAYTDKLLNSINQFNT